MIGSRVDDRVRDRQPALVGAEVALQRRGPSQRDVLDGQRLVEPVLVPDRREHRRVAVLAAERERRVARAARARPTKTSMLARRRTIRAAPALRRRKPPMIVVLVASS